MCIQRTQRSWIIIRFRILIITRKQRHGGKLLIKRMFMEGKRGHKVFKLTKLTKLIRQETDLICFKFINRAGYYNQLFLFYLLHMLK